MDKTGSDPSFPNVNPEQSSQEIGLSSEEMLGLISLLLNSKLDKKFSEYKRGLEQKELETSTKIKKLKAEVKALSSFQFKGNKLQFELNSSLLDSINSIKSDELADDSEDEKKLRSAERRALPKLRTCKQNRGTAQNRTFP